MLVPSKAEAAAFLDQLALQHPVLLLEAIVGGEDLAVDELAGGLPNQLMLFGDLLRRHHRRWIGFRDQPRAAFYRRFARCRCHLFSFRHP